MASDELIYWMVFADYHDEWDLPDEERLWSCVQSHPRKPSVEEFSDYAVYTEYKDAVWRANCVDDHATKVINLSAEGVRRAIAQRGWEPDAAEVRYGLAMSFWIDTDGYTDRDREMFVCGAEFQQIYTELMAGWRGSKPIHRENESRVRMMCGKLGIGCLVVPHKDYEGCETWSELTVTENES